jgi:UDP-N-acetylglucosamine diphosphorylase/glucosamine-1-phosphate N-acetyltransferase
MKIVLYEDQRVENIYPFSVLLAQWELLCGTMQNWQRASQFFGNDIAYLARPNIAESFSERYGIDLITTDKQARDNESDFKLYLSGGVLVSQVFYDIANQQLRNDSPTVITHKGHTIGIFTEKLFRSREEFLSYVPNDYHLIQLTDNDIDYIEYLHDAVYLNGKYITLDADNDNNTQTAISSNKYKESITGDNKLIVKGEITVGKNVVFDTSGGPIVIDSDVKIEHGVTIYGPCYIGKKTKIKTNAIIEPDCSFGPVCKIGGEVENSIVQGYSNKQHAGFLGHSYLGEWVNLGANTDNSDLKNTYGDISIKLRGEEVDTGKMFVGSMIGDHTKTAINTQLNTGTVIGIHCMIATEGFPPTDIRSYNWTGSKKNIIYKLKKAIGTADTVMARRDKKLNDYELKLMEAEYDRIKEYYYGK